MPQKKKPLINRNVYKKYNKDFVRKNTNYLTSDLTTDI